VTNNKSHGGGVPHISLLHWALVYTTTLFTFFIIIIAYLNRFTYYHYLEGKKKSARE
jgi:hypothetical protein